MLRYRRPTEKVARCRCWPRRVRDELAPGRRVCDGGAGRFPGWPFGSSSTKEWYRGRNSSAILGEAVQRAPLAESKAQQEAMGKSTAELNRQSAEILKFIAEKL